MKILYRLIWLFLLAMAGNALALNCTWENLTTGSWHTATNWSGPVPARVPLATDDIYMYKGGTAEIYEGDASGRYFYIGYSIGSASGHIIQNAYTLVATSLTLGTPGNNGRSSFTIKGGVLNVADRISFNSTAQMAAKLRIIGSALTANCYCAVGNMGVCEYIFTKNSPHIAPITTYHPSYNTPGYLRIGLDGGILLALTNAFSLHTWAYYPWGNIWTNVPDVKMWTAYQDTSLYAARVKLADGAGSYYRGELDMNGLKEISGFNQASGHVKINNMNNRHSLRLRLDVEPGAKTLADLVTDLAAAGYSKAAVQAQGDYDLVIELPPVDLPAQSPAYFAWDFTDVESGAVNATVKSVSCEYVPAGIVTILH